MLSLAKWERVALAFALTAAILFSVSRLQSPLGYDDAGYFAIAEHFARVGLFADYPFSVLRTYGYPFFLSGAVALGHILPVHPRIIAVIAQFALYLGGAILLRRELNAWRAGSGNLAFIGCCLNIFVLVYFAEILTDGVSAALLLYLVWALLGLARTRRLTMAAAAGLLAGFLIVIRPGNVFLAPFWFAAVLFSSFVARSFRTIALAIACLILPLLPQLWNNIKIHNAYTPLVPFDQLSFQHKLGVMALKYVTGPPDAPTVHYSASMLESVLKEPAWFSNDKMCCAANVQVFYENPLFAGTQLDYPLQWYVMHPVRGVATFALHIFALVDQDFIFPYPTTLHPHYRVVTSTANHLMLALAFCGAWMFVRRSTWGLWVLVGAYIGGFISIYGLTAVEARFGLPILVFAAPLAAWTCAALPSITTRALTTVVLSAAIYTSVALLISNWMRDQAPSIRCKSASCGISIRTEQGRFLPAKSGGMIRSLA